MKLSNQIRKKEEEMTKYNVEKYNLVIVILKLWI